MPDATFYGSRETGGLIATAQPRQHERIAARKEFDNERENVKTRVFIVGNGDAVSLQDAVANISSEASVTADRASNSLIVTATPEEPSKSARLSTKWRREEVSLARLASILCSAVSQSHFRSAEGALPKPHLLPTRLVAVYLQRLPKKSTLSWPRSSKNLTRNRLDCQRSSRSL
ncbi:MAG: hypothetical protein R3C56_10305 [Pirellulaceae bacterium]